MPSNLNFAAGFCNCSALDLQNSNFLFHTVTKNWKLEKMTLVIDKCLDFMNI